MFNFIPSYWLSVTPSDTTYYTSANVGLYVTVAGDVAFEGEGGAVVTVAAVAAKSYIWSRVKRVMSTNTTATGIFLLVK